MTNRNYKNLDVCEKVLLLTLGTCARVKVVVLSVCVSGTELAATYLDYTMKVRCQ